VNVALLTHNTIVTKYLPRAFMTSSKFSLEASLYVLFRTRDIFLVELATEVLNHNVQRQLHDNN